MEPGEHLEEVGVSPRAYVTLVADSPTFLVGLRLPQGPFAPFPRLLVLAAVGPELLGWGRRAVLLDERLELLPRSPRRFAPRVVLNPERWPQREQCDQHYTEATHGMFLPGKEPTDCGIEALITTRRARQPDGRSPRNPRCADSRGVHHGVSRLRIIPRVHA